MPFYEYKCSNCGHTLTKLQKINDPALTTCPECHQETLVKLISATACELKGVGVFGSSKHPFATESTAPKPSPASSSASPACASCPHAS
ncbi:MAG TPA: zinc ribbon domain-containing protein [Candidatus Anaerobiospirillum pullistercoris]|uniref:Zinc ribbon domain-containing protein n=1 Tax=Candidatus Anaerobiospirillum pullistercoris TaxID=2838452 RepID=A0A9D2B0J2_9GAMM|nr:zinc ribbon domain-containing protein [Candidatus Anaerobiospirillum pullistercoris]